MAMQTETNTNSLVSNGAPSGGYVVGQTSTSLVGFYGTAPLAQITTYTALTDSSGGTAAAGTGIQALTSTYNSGLIVNGISTCAGAINGILANLRTLGIFK
jgi:hypothetical protein